MRKYREYTDQQIIENAKTVYSLSELIKSVGLVAAGGNFIHMKKTLQRLNVETDHWTGRAWNKNKKLKDYSEYSRIAHLKKHLINDRGHKCEKCNLTNWLGEYIVLEVDHIDGDRTNNNEINLKLLCPNCHSQTPTWRNRKR